MKWSIQAALLMLWIGSISAAVVLFTDVPLWFVVIILAFWIGWYWRNHDD